MPMLYTCLSRSSPQLLMSFEASHKLKTLALNSHGGTVLLKPGHVGVCSWLGLWFQPTSHVHPAGFSWL